MDENHYNFIKRSIKIPQKTILKSRPILDLIENYDKPVVRPNTVDLQRGISHSFSTPKPKIAPK